MGLGKTIEVLAYLVTCKEAFPCLIVAPLVTLINWQREIEKFIKQKKGKPYTVLTIRTGKTGDLLAGLEKQPQIFLINYDLVSKRRDDLAALPLQTIIADEVQNLRNPYALKSEALRELADIPTVKHRIGLSGTPCYNHGTEIWSICDFIYPGLLGNYSEFSREFVDQWDPHKSVYKDKREALFEILNQNIMLRRRKIDVLDLPEKVRYKQTIQIDEEYYNKEMKKHIFELQKKLDDSKAKTQFQKISEIAAYGDFQNNDRQTAGISKVSYVAEFIDEIMDTGESVVVFCHHKIVHDMLKARLRKYFPVVIRGGQTDRERQCAIDCFQSGETKLMITGLRAGNVGINLTKATYVIFAELDWSPAIHRQAEDRLHRFGQKKTVFAYYLEGVGTLDEKIAEILVNKKLELDEIFGDANRSDKYSEADTLSEQTKQLVYTLQERFKKIPMLH
jgi:SNF2 family DNA or RNA helicase